MYAYALAIYVHAHTVIFSLSVNLKKIICTCWAVKSYDLDTKPKLVFRDRVVNAVFKSFVLFGYQSVKIAV